MLALLSLGVGVVGYGTWSEGRSTGQEPRPAEDLAALNETVSQIEVLSARFDQIDELAGLPVAEAIPGQAATESDIARLEREIRRLEALGSAVQAGDEVFPPSLASALSLDSLEADRAAFQDDLRALEKDPGGTESTTPELSAAFEALDATTTQLKEEIDALQADLASLARETDSTNDSGLRFAARMATIVFGFLTTLFAGASLARDRTNLARASSAATDEE